MKIQALIVSVVLLIPLAARAQDVSADCPERPDDEDQARAQAGEWFGKAEALFKQKLYNAALGAFECSLRMAEHPNSYFNAAQTARAAGKKERALELARRSLEQGAEGSIAEKAQEIVTELEAEGVGAEPVVDEEPIPAAEPEPEPEVPPEPLEEADEPADQGPPDLKLPGYVLLGVGAAGVVFGAILQGVTGAAASDAEETNDYSVFKDKKDKGEKMQKGAIACFVIGGVAAAAGLTLVLLDGGDEEAGGEVALAPALGGLTLEGSF